MNRMKEAYDLYKSGVSVKDIAAKFYVSKSIVYRRIYAYCHETGEPLPSRVSDVQGKNAFEAYQRFQNWQDAASYLGIPTATAHYAGKVYAAKNRLNLDAWKLDQGREIYLRRTKNPEQKPSWNVLGSEFGVSAPTARSRARKYALKNRLPFLD